MRAHATAHGSEAFAALAQVVGVAKGDDPLAPVTVIARDDIAALSARRALAHGVAGRRGVAVVDVTTVRRAADLVLDRAGVARLPLTASRLTVLWRAALDDDPGLLREVAHHPATVRALARAHAELRLVGDAALELIASSSALGADLVRMHRVVVARVLESHVDEAEVLRLATTTLLATPAATAALGAVILFLPDEPSSVEAAFIEAVDAAADVTVVRGVVGEPALDATLASVLGLEASDALPLEEPAIALTASEIVHASDADDEVRAIVRRVVQDLASGMPAHRIAVLHAKPTPYSRLLHDHLRAAGIVTNGPGARALRDRAVADGFLAYLGLDPEDLQRGAVFEWLSRAPVRADDGSGSVPRAPWERLSREAGLTGGRWDERLRAFAAADVERLEARRMDADASEASIAFLERRIERTEALARFMAGVVDELRAGRAVESWSGLSAWALEAFRRRFGAADDLSRLPEPEQRAATAIDGILRGLAELDDQGRVATLPDLVEILEVELDRARPRVGRFGEGVFVGPITSAPSLDVDRLFVLGLSEDLFPGRQSADPLLPEVVRVATGELDTLGDRLRGMQRALLAAFGSAPRVTASLARGDLRRGAERLPSRWLMPTLRALTGDDALAATRWLEASSPRVHAVESHWAGIVRADHPSTEQEWRLRQQASGSPLPADEPALDAAITYAAARASAAFTRYDGNLEGVVGLPNFEDGAARVSPTSLERYASCPHAYFVGSILGVAPIEAPEDIVSIRAVDVGTIVHEVMDRLTRESADALPDYGRPWTAGQRARMRVIADEVMADFERRGLTGHPRLWEREREQLLRSLEWLLDADDEARADRDTRIVASELRFGLDGADPVAVAVDGGSVLMRGAADRVDEARDGTLIVTDFKTGSARGFVDIRTGSDPVVAGTKLQLPAYAHAARAAYGHDRVEAAYWFVGRRNRGERVPVVLDDGLQQRYRSAVGTLVRGIRDGRFIARPPAVDDFAWVQCAYCNPDAVGYGHVRGASDRKRSDEPLRELFALLDPPKTAPEEGDR